MTIRFINGELYDIPDGGQMPVVNDTMFKVRQNIGQGYINPLPQNQGNNGSNPFSSASSGGVSGTLQPYVNRMTQNANQALYGGLLGYQPQSIIAGNAGGTPVNSTAPQWRLPSAIPTPNQGQVGLLGPQANPQQQMGIFGNRSWMGA